MLQLKDKDQIIFKRANSIACNKENEDQVFLLSFLLRLPKDFRRLRSACYLSRLVARVQYNKRRLEDVVQEQPFKRSIFVKFLPLEVHSHFGSKKLMGILLAFNAIHQHEVFKEHHFIQLLQQIEPRARPLEGSFIDFSDPNDSLSIVYIESSFPQEDQSNIGSYLLNKRLIEELQNSIEVLVPITFKQRNEEEIYRHLLVLKDQLRTSKDLPQVMIEFEGQTTHKLEFTVLVARLIKKDSKPVAKLLKEKNFSWTVDKEEVVGKLGGKCLKEALIFKVELPKKFFFRKDHSLNLFKARRHLINEVTSLFGAVRDFNGGLIDKQQEHFQNFKSFLPSFFDEFLLENFFFSLSPIFIQSILSPIFIKNWFLIIYNAEEKELYQIDVKNISGGEIVSVKVEEEAECEILLKKIKDNAECKEIATARLYLSSSWNLSFFFKEEIANLKNCLMDNLKQGVEECLQKKSSLQCLRLSFIDKEPILDPRLSKEDQSYLIIKMLYDGLTRLKADGTIELAMAEKVEISSDFKRFVFHLRCCMWSNGEPITAYDFEYSWKMALHPKVHTIFSHPLFIIHLAKEASLGQVSIDQVGICALDSKTLEVNLSDPCPTFLERTSHWTYFLINSQIDRQNPGWAMRAGHSYVCNGPFVLDQWHANRSMSLIKNPYYWDVNSVELDKIYLHLGQNASKAWELFCKKEIDFFGRPIHRVPPFSLQHLPDHAIKKKRCLKGVYLLWLNTSRLPFSNKKLREAFSLAIDKSTLLSLLPDESIKIANSILPSTFSQIENGKKCCDKQEAKRLFNEGMKEERLSKKELRNLVICHTSGMSREALFSQLCSIWNDTFKLDLRVESYEWRVHFDKLVRRDFDIGGMELHAWWNDPLHLLEYFKSSEDPLNLSSWECKKYADILKKASSEEDLIERQKSLKEAEKILVNEIPAISLYEMEGTYLISKALEGEFVSEFFEIDFKWARLKKEGI